jgi:hypothetical protein
MESASRESYYNFVVNIVACVIVRVRVVRVRVVRVRVNVGLGVTCRGLNVITG